MPDSTDPTRDIPASEWLWSGYAAHLTVSDCCLWHMTTRVGNFIVSSVGHFRPTPESAMEPLANWKDGFYEVNVFNAPEKGWEIEDFEEIFSGRYKTESEATEAHMAACRRYA